MIYRFTVTTPANTAEADKLDTRLVIARGVIHQIEVQFPPGPMGLLHCQISRASNHLWPTNADESFASDSFTISFREHYELVQPPYELHLWTWNLDDTLEHSILIRIGLLKRKFILRRLL